MLYTKKQVLLIQRQQNKQNKIVTTRTYYLGKVKSDFEACLKHWVWR